jgi:GntR family transcriptional repressor for pyruvate dehydrogenase complex
MQFEDNHSIKKKRLYEHVVEEIKEKILSQEFNLNDKLPSVRFLAKYFNVSAGTIRNALNELSSMGLVRIDHGRGVFVVGLTLKKYIRSLGENIEVQLKKADDLLVQLIESRKIIECQVASLSAKRHTEADLKALEAILKRGDKYIKERDLSYFNKIDLEFHNAIVRSSNNNVLSYLMKAISRPLMKSLVRIHPHIDTIVNSHAEHLLIFKCIQESDSDGAAEIMLKHLDAAEKELLSNLKNTKKKN